MPDAHIAPGQVVDPAEKNQPGIGQGRDPERSPMLWSDLPNAGFTAPEAKPWLPLVNTWEAFTVESQAGDSASMLQLYRRLLALRKLHPSLHSGAVSEVCATDGVLSYLRTQGDERLQILLNMTSDDRSTPCLGGELVFSSFLDRTGDFAGQTIELRAAEAVILRLT